MEKDVSFLRLRNFRKIHGFKIFRVFQSSQVAQPMRDPASSLQQLSHCCGAGSISGLGTSTCPGHSQKEKKKDFWNPDILMCQCPVLSQARLYSWHWRPSMAESLSSRTLLLWWFSCESLAQISLYPHCRYFSEPLCNLPRGILTLTLFFQLPVAFSFSLSFF